MPDINVEKIKCFGKLSDRERAPEFNLVKWGGTECYDLRPWDAETDKPYKGITIQKRELPKLFQLLNKAKNSEKPGDIKYEVQVGNGKIRIFEVYGCFGKKNEYDKLVTYATWGYGNKYELRLWKDNISECGKGIGITEDECAKLIALISTIISSNEKDDDIQGASIEGELDKDLLL